MAKKTSGLLDAFKGLTQKKGGKDKEVEKYEKILEETPDDRNALNALGDLYAKRGDAARASEYYLRVGELYARGGFTLKAIAVYKKAQRAQPDVIQTYIDLADLYVQKGLIGEAKSNYLTAAEMQAAAGAKHESLDIYRKIADLDPNNVNIRSKLGAMYEKENFIEDAAIIYAEIGDALLEEDAKEAKKYYAQAMQVQSENEDILARIGYAYAERDMRKDAVKIFQRLLKLDPKNIDYQEQLEELQVVPGRQKPITETAAITFSEEELGSLNFGETPEIELENLTGLEPESTPEAEHSLEPSTAPEDHVLDFQIEAQGAENQDLQDISQTDQPVDLFVSETESQPPTLGSGDGQGSASEYFDLASRLDTAAQIGRGYDGPPATSGPNLKVEASEGLAGSEISDIIREFKQGVLEEVGAEDYETHYELGISYKEMSLLDDAIEELKLAALEPSKFVECQGVIGLCYIEKGDYDSAIVAFQEARSRVNGQSEEYQDLTYQIAVSYEESGKIEEAAQELQALYQMNPGYRDVKQRLKRLL